ncbi:MAG: V-type ATP synthase subunit A [Acidilobus sp.]|nr:MAG: Archaeal/vacuolar-type H+-ATPase subunit A [uncultured Acidilobus sp. MG]
MPVRGRIVRISGPLVVAEGMTGVQMYEMVRVGEQGLIGEVTRIRGDTAYVQVYESTSGLRPGEPVEGTGAPLSVELGPGVIGSIFDGIQRPLPLIAQQIAKANPARSIFVERGVNVPPIPRDKKWHFVPREGLKAGDKVSGGDIIGAVQETPLVLNKVMVPPNVFGVLKWVASEGDYTIVDPIAEVETGEGEVKQVYLSHRWPVRIPRPYSAKLDPTEPLITGMRIIDLLFPMAKGGTGMIPGGFGTGKTVTLHSLAQWSSANVIIYIGCGERGNEMTEVLERFPTYKDPWTGRPLMERTILIANTSNMPVAAREASIYVGITMAEYYRDMGYDVLLVADSTSRWAEALREIAGRLEEMPAEEGYPSYLASRLAEFYERAGRVRTMGSPERLGSVTVVGAVSPPGGDFTEPVTTHTRRFTKVFWALDTALAYSRHYPAINWILSYSAYAETVEGWWRKNVDERWAEYRKVIMDVLIRENALREIVRLVGTEGLSEQDKLVLETARLIKDGLLKQNAFDPIDTFTTPQKQVALMRMFVEFYRAASEAIKRNVTVAQLREAIGRLYTDMVKARFNIPNDKVEEIEKLTQSVVNIISKLGGG